MTEIKLTFYSRETARSQKENTNNDNSKLLVDVRFSIT